MYFILEDATEKKAMGQININLFWRLVQTTPTSEVNVDRPLSDKFLSSYFFYLLLTYSTFTDSLYSSIPLEYTAGLVKNMFLELFEMNKNKKWERRWSKLLNPFCCVLQSLSDPNQNRNDLQSPVQSDIEMQVTC